MYVVSISESTTHTLAAHHPETKRGPDWGARVRRQPRQRKSSHSRGAEDVELLDLWTKVGRQAGGGGRACRSSGRKLQAHQMVIEEELQLGMRTHEREGGRAGQSRFIAWVGSRSLL